MSTIERIWLVFWNYYGYTFFGAAFLAILIAALPGRKIPDGLKAMLWASVVLLAVIVCPLSARVLMHFMGKQVYWRVFWMPPILPVFAWTMVRLSELFRQRWKNVLLTVLAVAAVILHGRLIFSRDLFDRAANPYKLSAYMIEATEAIKEHAAEHKVKKIKIVGTLGYASQVRQYDASVKQRYGRIASMDASYSSPLYYQINTQGPDLDVIADGAIQSRCRYIVMQPSEDDPDILDGRGFDYVFENEQYVVYFNREYDRSSKKKGKTQDEAE